MLTAIANFTDPFASEDSDNAYDSDASSLLSSAPVTRSQRPAVSPDDGQPTIAHLHEAHASDPMPALTTASSPLQPAPLRYPPLEFTLMPLLRYRFQLLRLHSRIQAAVGFAQLRCPALTTALQHVVEECDELCDSLPPQDLSVRIPNDDLLELASVYPSRPETTHDYDHYFPAALHPLLLRHREQLGLMSSELYNAMMRYSWPSSNPIVYASAYIRRVERLLAPLSPPTPSDDHEDFVH
ncbi:hypothetical protein B0H16DRAFT_1505585 [Mycena metata]|uniref:Uncharacterized protein n=1 Tax=Mycena metata TaxID=1033252 RepID=A0AAD7K3G2_9AGAR|nr:hypothetical protein B0H16DRAFT_1505585 [Mycena metata]